jgi:hypothetical protein
MRTRVALATKSDAVSDAQLAEIIERDIEVMLRGDPNIKPFLVAAFRSASAVGKTVIETAAAKVDRGFSSTLGSGSVR